MIILGTFLGRLNGDLSLALLFLQFCQGLEREKPPDPSTGSSVESQNEVPGLAHLFQLIPLFTYSTNI